MVLAHVDLLRAYRPAHARSEPSAWVRDHEARCAALEARAGAAQYRCEAEIERALAYRRWRPLEAALRDKEQD